MRNIGPEVTRKSVKTSQGRFAEPPLGDKVSRRIRSCSLLATRYWLEGEACKAFIKILCGSKSASRSLLSEFVDGVRDCATGVVHATRIHHKQIAWVIKCQALCAVRHGTKRRPRIPA